MLYLQYKGRTGNLLLQAIGGSIMADQLDLTISSYPVIPNAKELLGLQLSSGGRRQLTGSPQSFTDADLPVIMAKKPHEITLPLQTADNSCYFQTAYFITQFKDRIRAHLHYQIQPRNSAEVFVHVRLSDVTIYNPGYDYYADCLTRMGLSSGYLSTDSPDHPIVRQLLQQFSLQLLGPSYDAIAIFHFAKDFNRMVLSKGTFSWWCGFLSQAREVYYPVDGSIWAPDELFLVMDEWHPVYMASFEKLEKPS